METQKQTFQRPDMRQMLRKMFGPPNFILIHTDQQRADCIRAYGHRPELYTPYMDSIASMGARFDSCYSACPVCIPARLSLLTGQSPQKHGVLANIGIPDLPLATTFPSEMKKGGYHTALFGRTMHTYPFSNSYGFEEYVPGDPSNNDKENDFFFQFLEKEGAAGHGGYNGNGTFNNSRFAAPFHLADYFHQTMWATNQAVDYLERRRADKKPFCMFLGFYAPHSPHNPPAEWFNYYLNQSLPDRMAIAEYDIPPISNGHPISTYVDLQGEDYRRLLAGYYGNISFIDSQVGRIINAITSMPNTYVIFTSDHGEMLGDHYHVHKEMPYQGSVHIPFLIYGPGIAGNQVIDTPFSWHDIMPTVLELAGLPVPDSCDGISFAQNLLHPEAPIPLREYLHGECRISKVRFTGYEGQATENNIAYEDGVHYLTDGKTKYIWFNQSGKEQLFDLVQDAQELHNLADNLLYQKTLLQWRAKMMEELMLEGTGLSDGQKLICKVEDPLHGQMQELLEKRIKEGKSIAYYMPDKNVPRQK